MIDIISPFISVGPRIDYLIAHSKHFDDLDKNDDLKKINTGILVGGGVKLDISKFQFGARADYYINFNKISDRPADGDNNSFELLDKTFTINLTIGYKIN